jgi:xylulokinase
VLPDPSARNVYDMAYAVFRALYPATRDAAHRLSAIERLTHALKDAA